MRQSHQKEGHNIFKSGDSAWKSGLIVGEHPQLARLLVPTQHLRPQGLDASLASPNLCREIGRHLLGVCLQIFLLLDRAQKAANLALGVSVILPGHVAARSYDSA